MRLAKFERANNVHGVVRICVKLEKHINICHVQKKKINIRIK